MPYIDKDLLLKDIRESVVFTVRDAATSPELRGARKILDRIENAPAADAVEVVHGEWVKEFAKLTTAKLTGEDSTIVYRCSRCGRYESQKEPYCNCGAKMDRERRTGNDV